jgi:hypothetical protein
MTTYLPQHEASLATAEIGHVHDFQVIKIQSAMDI